MNRDPSCCKSETHIMAFKKCMVRCSMEFCKHMIGAGINTTTHVRCHKQRRCLRGLLCMYMNSYTRIQNNKGKQTMRDRALKAIKTEATTNRKVKIRDTAQQLNLFWVSEPL